MATVLDIGILSNLSGLFVFFLVFAVSLGIMKLTNIFKFEDEQSKKLYAFIAFCIALLAVLSKQFITFISFSLPWFVILTLVGFFFIFFIRMFNPDYDSGWLINQNGVWGLLAFFVILIVLFGFSKTFGQDLLEQQPGITPADQIQGDYRPVDEFVPVDEFNTEYQVEQQQQTQEFDSGGGAVHPVQQGTRTTAGSDVNSNIALTIFHPKILGMILVLAIGALTVLLLGR